MQRWGKRLRAGGCREVSWELAICLGALTKKENRKEGKEEKEDNEKNARKEAHAGRQQILSKSQAKQWNTPFQFRLGIPQLDEGLTRGEKARRHAKTATAAGQRCALGPPDNTSRARRAAARAGERMAMPLSSQRAGSFVPSLLIISLTPPPLRQRRTGARKTSSRALGVHTLLPGRGEQGDGAGPTRRQRWGRQDACKRAALGPAIATARGRQELAKGKEEDNKRGTCCDGEGVEDPLRPHVDTDERLKRLKDEDEQCLQAEVQLQSRLQASLLALLARPQPHERHGRMHKISNLNFLLRHTPTTRVLGCIQAHRRGLDRRGLVR